MGSFSDTPALIAGGDIYPFRFVKCSTAADDTGLQAAEITTPILGVSDGSTKVSVGTGSDLHAASGDPITLQGGDVVLVQAGGNITRGAMVQSDSNGKAVTAATTTGLNYQGYVALQSASDGLVIRVQRIAGFARYA
jgi:hypothetical protein